VTGRNKNKNKGVCYYCGAPGPTREHVPPICFFPEIEDAKIYTDKDFRQQLITVRSCKKHNNSKSPDDAYLLYLFFTYIYNNPEIQKIVLEKVKRAIKRNPRLSNIYKRNPRPVVIDDKTGVLKLGVNIDIDIFRVNSEIDMMAHALYFYEYNECLSQKIKYF
jgi:hypothetical protein